MMPLVVRAWSEEDLAVLMEIWNQVVEEGLSFPQEEYLNLETARKFFEEQTHVGAAVLDGRIVGLYILHPNNVGRCSHVANASYGVHRQFRGRGIGRMLVADSLEQCWKHGFRGMQFNAVVSTNEAAMRLYPKLGFTRIGTIPEGFRLKDGSYVDTNIFYKGRPD